MSSADAAEQLGHRERKKLLTKERIVECAIALFAERGYDATTMGDIGEGADVSRATVFNYFPRKEDIISEVFRRRREELDALITEATDATTSTHDRLRRVLGGLARSYEDDGEIRRATVRAWLRAGGPLLPEASDSAALFAEVVRLGQQEGDVPPEVDATNVGLVILDAYVGALFRWVGHEGGEFDLEEQLMASLDVVLADRR